MTEVFEHDHRHSAISQIAGKLRQAGLPKDLIEVALSAINQAACAPPLDEAFLKDLVDKVSCAGTGPPLVGVPIPVFFSRSDDQDK